MEVLVCDCRIIYMFEFLSLFNVMHLFIFVHALLLCFNTYVFNIYTYMLFFILISEKEY